MRFGRQHVRAVDHARRSVFVEKRNQRFADFELHDRLLRVEFRILAQRVGRDFDRFLIARGERSKRVLNAVAELRQGSCRGRPTGFA